MFITKQNHTYKRNKDDCPFDLNSHSVCGGQLLSLLMMTISAKWTVLSSQRCLCIARKEKLLFNSKMLSASPNQIYLSANQVQTPGP